MESVAVYDHHPEYRVHSVEGDLILFGKIPVPTIELPERRFQTFLDVSPFYHWCKTRCHIYLGCTIRDYVEQRWVLTPPSPPCIHSQTTENSRHRVFHGVESWDGVMEWSLESRRKIDCENSYCSLVLAFVLASVFPFLKSSNHF